MATWSGDESGGQKNVQGPRHDLASRPHAERIALQQSIPRGPTLRSRRFAPCGSHRAIVRSTSPHIVSTGTGISPAVFHSLPTTACATIQRSTFPTCPLQFHTEPLPESVRFLATSLRVVFEALRGVINTLNPFLVLLFSAAATVYGLHSPSGLATFRIKAFSRSCHREPAAANRFRPALTIVP